MAEYQLEIVKQACDQIRQELESWSGVYIERQQIFMRTDGIPMLYIRAKTQHYYLHIEGMMKMGHVRWYAKLTQSIRNKHAHKDEIIGWDNLYHERPHVHFDEDQRREYHTQPLTWNDIRETLARLEATS
jgi:hypothetical protein